MYGLIGGVAVLVMLVAVICNDGVNNLYLDIVKNLAYGCVASTIVAFLVEVGNIKDKNEQANKIYDAVFSDVKGKIMWFVGSWARLCSVAYNENDYRNEKHTWIEWYEIAKCKFAECESDRQDELIRFFGDQLMRGIEGIEEALNQIDRQQYILHINGIYDDKLKGILSDYSFECHAAKLALGRGCDRDEFWSSFDAINTDLKEYIHNWVDIRYYNHLNMKPFGLHNDEADILHAVLESKKECKAVK